MFVAGNIASLFADALVRGGFLESFLDKGRFRPMLEQVPVAIVLDPNIGLAGSRLQAALALEGIKARG